MLEDTRLLYLKIVAEIRGSEWIVKNCWRYHMTYMKVMESLLFSEKHEEVPVHV